MSRIIEASRILVGLFIFMALCLGSRASLAECHVSKQSPNQIPVVINIDLGDIIVPAWVSDGDVIKSVDIRDSDKQVDYDCSSTTLVVNRLLASRSPILEHVFDSGVAGVGYKILDGLRQPANSVDEFSIGLSGYSNMPAFELQLVKTGPITPGYLATQQWGVFTVDRIGDVYPLQVVSGRIIVPTCDAIGAQTIELDRLSAKAIDGNTTAGDKVISIPMNCATGFKIFAKLSGTTPPGTTATGLIQNTGTAPGVSVQLIDGNSQPIRLGDRIEQANHGANTVYKIGARAYKTGAVGAGTIQAQATLTMTYE